MTAFSAAGTTLEISTDAPATYDADGYGALDYTEILGIEKIGTIGAVFDKIEFQPLKGAKQKHRGPVDYGSLQPSMAHDDGDAGQTMLRTASGGNDLHSFRVTYPSGELRYFRGRVFGYPENVDGASAILMAVPTIEIDTVVVKVAAEDDPGEPVDPDAPSFDFSDADNSQYLPVFA